MRSSRNPHSLAVRRQRRVALACALAVTLASLALRWGVPINPISLSLAAFDGGLFERLAASLTAHDWLGPLQSTTLAKGPAYPLFMAASYWLHLPLQLAHQATYLVGAGAVAGFAYVVTRRPYAALFIYAVLAFDPANYSALGAHVTREHIYTGLSLVFVCGFASVVVLGVRARSRRAIVGLIAIAGATGLGGAGFWLCREEGIWVLPALGIIGLGCLGPVLWRARRTRAGMGSLTIRMVAAGVVLAIAFAVPIGVVHAKNKSVYGYSATTDFASGNFPKAYAAWSRVRGVPLRDFVPINEAQRRALYRVSNTARVLEPFLESPDNGWKKWACPAESRAAGRGAESINICDDYPGGAEPWAIREAALAAGQFDDEISFQRYFGLLLRDIESACSSGRLECSTQLPSSLQLLQRASVGEVAGSAFRWLRLLPGHGELFDVYGPVHVNEVTSADRKVINRALIAAPESQADAERAARDFGSRAWIYRGIGYVYRVAFPLLILGALVGVAWLVRRRRATGGINALCVLAVALLAAVMTRLVMFGVIATTQYFNHIRYQLVTRSFLLAAVLLVLVAATDPDGSMLRVVRRRGRAERPGPS